MSHKLDKAFQHENGKGQEMQASQGFRQPFVVASQSAAASSPGKAALNDPTAGQQDKAQLGFWELDDFQLNAMLGRILGWLVAGVALVDKSQFYRLTGEGLNLLGQLLNLGTLWLIGWRDKQGQQMTQRVNGHMRLAA